VLPPASDEGDPLPQTDDSERPSTLPRPELNPLLNPILGQNLGRWAEVYFTTPPETREQALQELLRELEAQQSGPESASFSDEGQAPQIAEIHSGSPAWSGQTAGTEFFPREDAAQHRAWSPDGLSQDQADQQAASAKTWYSTLATAIRRHYLYAGSVFAIVGLLTLAYAVWLGAPATSGSSLPAQGPAVAVGPSAGAEPQQPPVENSRQGDIPSRGQAGAPYDATGPAKAPGKSRPGSDEAAAALTPAGTRAAITPPAGGSPDGSEELALARKYLNANGGQERNAAEAAKWLWKAVAKQNGEATGLLATLYLEGDGVPKNCDQARLLLTAAARKGVKDVAARLEHLQASGCE